MIRAILTVARRDFTATVFNRSFVLWVAMPLVFMLLSPLIGLVLASQAAPSAASTIALVDPDARLRAWLEQAIDQQRAAAAYAELRARFHLLRPAQPLPAALAMPPDALSAAQLAALARPGAIDALARALDLAMPFAGGTGAPRIAFVTADGDPTAAARRLLRIEAGGRSARFAGVIVADAAGERLLVGQAEVDVDAVTRLVNDARVLRMAPQAAAAVRAARGPLSIERLARSERDAARTGRTALANAAVFVLFLLIGLLSQLLLSNMVEEKTNKIIEVLTASVPVPAIFAGKLVGMLAVSLVGITVWGTAAGLVAALAVPQLPAGLLPVPAVGWPAFLALGLAYFVTAYLIFGGVYLGIGALCSSIREVQSLALPATIVTTTTLLLTIAAIGHPAGLLADVLHIVPLSSPFMALASAALDEQLLGHLAAIGWQLAFAALVIRQSARLFRRGVLSSGPAPSLLALLRRALRASGGS